MAPTLTPTAAGASSPVRVRPVEIAGLTYIPRGGIKIGMNHGTQAHTQHTQHEHSGHTGHEGHQARAGGSSWRMAASATLHCLTGCAIGETLGMVLATWWGWSTWPAVGLAVVLAFVFGYSLTIAPVLRAGVPFRSAVKVALAADTISITVMEIVDNAVMVGVPGAMHAGLGNWIFWAALAFAFAVAFVVTLPVNKWLIGRGKGHAVVHEFHH